jgi:FkbM family methyltransferase
MTSIDFIGRTPEQPIDHKIHEMIKKTIRKLLGRLGYVVLGVGEPGSVTGIDLLRDVQVLLGQKQPVILFDIGANMGQTVTSFLERFVEPRIYSFEPSPSTFETLRAAHGRDSRIQLENLALGDREESLPIHVTKDFSVNDSLLEPSWDAKAKTSLVQATTLDHYCQDHGIELIDYLKIDTQGYDLNVLRGGTQLLKEKRVRTFSVELIFTPMYRGQPVYTEVLSFPAEFGYQLLGFYEQTYRHNRLVYGNALFVTGDHSL